MNQNATLVIMAAGIGSRFGGGIKQLEPVGPDGEIIMDYSIYDALEAGFNKVVFVIRKDLEKDFKKIIGDRISKKIEVAYAFQELEDIPAVYQTRFKARVKPWGTGQAILACRDIVKEPFAVINADDYYGKEAYQEAYQYLVETASKEDKLLPEIAMVSFLLKNTLSDNGTVTRGVCQINEQGYLESIVETYDIAKGDGNAIVDGKALSVDTPVSMNMFCLFPAFFSTLQARFDEFLSHTEQSDLKAEYLIPSVVGELLAERKLVVKVLHSRDQWFGVTYKEDKEVVVEGIQALIAKGYY
ncbi:MAG: sugar phosphate nucleotidyltransferase [Lachnospiraceae bacterium]|nr:sugar phosphate nucleotidyltransferase [Lachnospiraceae bacterium]